MDAYQELLNERNKLAAQVSAQAVEINALEQSMAVRIGKRLNRFAPVMHQLLRAARVVRKWHGKLRRPVAMPKMDGGTNDSRPVVMVLVAKAIATPQTLSAQALMRALQKSYHVVTVLLGDGNLEFSDGADAVVGPLHISEDRYAKALSLAEGLAAAYRPRFAIVTSGDAAHLGMTLSTAGVPVIALMHELPAALKITGNNAQTLMDRADDIIFSGDTVQDLYRPFYKRMEYRRTHVMVPAVGEGPQAARLRDRLGYIADDCFLVVGLGPIDYRNGVDLFVATAAVWHNTNPESGFHFVWIGTAPDTIYSTYIDEQIARAGLQNFVTLIYQPDEAQTVYHDVDLVFASARLDYLPNAALGFAQLGKPVACFNNAGGIAEILANDPATCSLVLPYGDVSAAAKLLNDLAVDRESAKKLGDAVQLAVRQACDVSLYAEKLIALGEEAALARGAYPAIAALLAQPGSFDAALYAGKAVTPAGMAKAIKAYLERTYYDGFRKRALAGFHPEYYASQMPDAKVKRLDPLTHYLRAGRPAGPWLHRIIRLDNREVPAGETSRVALHGHFYYPDHIASLLQSLAANRTRADLFLTTGNEANRQYLLNATKDYKAGKVVVEIVPNKGRDIGPFLYLYRTQLHGLYDLIGHVHGKKSVHTKKWDPNFGERWRNFLFQHLIGPKAPAMDIVLQEFREDPKLGLVFPEDPNVIGWDYNLEHAQRLCERMGISADLPAHIDFPIGTMFWARAAALEPLMNLDISWDEYPPEPLPVDGTILHALERLLPSITRAAGYEYAATYFPGIGK